jgi:hypothetical protein
MLCPCPERCPYYDDPLESVRSIETLKVLEGVQVLLSDWDEPMEGSQIESISWLKVRNTSLGSIKMCLRI